MLVVVVAKLGVMAFIGSSLSAPHCTVAERKNCKLEGLEGEIGGRERFSMLTKMPLCCFWNRMPGKAIGIAEF